MTDSRPLPVPDPSSAPFWEAAAAHRLVIAHCSSCGRRSHPPDVACPHCGRSDAELTFEPAAGGGTVCS